ncbi:hypothetical protein QPX08_06275 [Corynebacterium propinquum]|uniref:hypothetical protein n=1 Tax=Corynebacterium propinquum TaxID=43769 RepID=UPI00254285F6|nr:hypothetical protein [Corynebacterium propinquum]MDK4239112.1 hypothetical protein [Corynebacterium propinquum]
MANMHTRLSTRIPQAAENQQVAVAHGGNLHGFSTIPVNKTVDNFWLRSWPGVTASSASVSACNEKTHSTANTTYRDRTHQPATTS